MEYLTTTKTRNPMIREECVADEVDMCAYYGTHPCAMGPEQQNLWRYEYQRHLGYLLCALGLRPGVLVYPNGYRVETK